MNVSLKSQLLAWRNVIFALYLREMQSKFNDKLGLGWAFIEPFIFIFALSFARSFISGSDVHSVPVFVFMMIGLMGVRTFIGSLSTAPNAMKANKPLYAFRQVQPMASVLASAFTDFLIKFGVIILVSLAVYLLNLDFQLADPLLVISIYSMLWIFSFSISLIFAVVIAHIPEVNKLRPLFNRPLFFISCTFFSLQDIPEKFWPWLTWNPLVHFIELARYACYPSYGVHGVSLQFAFEVTIVSLFLALALYHISWKKILAT